jgi:endonuclease YncB( thermonuclease family)
MSAKVWPYQWQFRARAVRVIDGDTIDFEVDLGFHLRTTQRIRLLGVDAPEKRGATMPSATEAQAYVQSWLDDHYRFHPSETDADEWPFFLRTAKSDSFDRWVASVMRRHDGRDLASDLLITGHAVAWKRK